MLLIVASWVALILLCGALGAVMVVIGGIDPLTAYPATIPGGADLIAIIAASTTLEMRFVLPMRIPRFVVVMMIAPVFSRWVVRVVGSGSLLNRFGPVEDRATVAATPQQPADQHDRAHCRRGRRRNPRR